MVVEYQTIITGHEELCLELVGSPFTDSECSQVGLPKGLPGGMISSYHDSRQREIGDVAKSVDGRILAYKITKLRHLNESGEDPNAKNVLTTLIFPNRGAVNKFHGRLLDMGYFIRGTRQRGAA